jgi:D-alanyl-lipoteichoic acid acyltransferase DltB (MBOAT superfamily)
MLFTSFSFLFAFLPVVFVAYQLLLRWRAPRLAFAMLAMASLVFYGWMDMRLAALLIFSIFINFGCGIEIHAGRKFWMLAGVLFNLGLLAWFKYADFAVETANALTGLDAPLLQIALPIGISFYTFQQIAWLVDMAREPREPRFWDYVLFVAFFPQLIAGPIVHHAEMMPQFERLAGIDRSRYFRRLWTHMAVGLSILAIGLFKKVVIADGCGEIANGMFSAASAGQQVGTFAAWGGTLAYTFQIYFDFSAYSDMAVGLARMFGIRLPMNFFSPYKATTIIEFWRRWHMTLSRWLRDYIYIPLGGNRKGPARRNLNLLATMLIGGLWHGAAWTYVLWGGLHGIMLIINHLWSRRDRRISRKYAWPLTFLAVVHAWVLFKAGEFPDGLATAGRVYAQMYTLSWSPITPDYLIVAAAFLIAAAWPNTYEIMRRYRPVIKMHSTQARDLVVAQALPIHFIVQPWRPTPAWLIIIVSLALTSLYILSRSQAYVQFIYFQF